MSVSYTHLDVYKRQHPGNVPTYQFASSDPDIKEFASFGERVLRMPLGEVQYAPLG